MSREIAAIDRRDVFRIQRAQIKRAVPVVEMPPEALKPVHRLERCLQALQGLVHPNPTEIAGGDHGQQVEPEIGRRRPVRNHRHRLFLKIVGRKHVILRRDEGLKEAPSPARDQAQRLGIGGGDRR